MLHILHPGSTPVPPPFIDPPKTFGDIRDGSSNTIALGEKCIGQVNEVAATGDATRKLIKRGFATDMSGTGNGVAVATGPAAGSAGVDPTSNGVPSRCSWLAVSDGKRYTRASSGEIGGITWTDSAGAGYTTFSTILPPNSPSCGGAPAQGGLQRILSSASSDHTAGVNVLRFDGSVRFINDIIETNSKEAGPGITATASTGLDRYAVNEGPSPYGVWGALGSINGTETPELP